MRRLKRFAQLTAPERRLLIRALFAVGVARTSLWVMPVEAVRRAVSRAAAGAASNSVEQVVWAVKAASRSLPGTTCLTQAIAAQALLTHSGFPKGEGILCVLRRNTQIREDPHSLRQGN